MIFLCALNSPSSAAGMALSVKTSSAYVKNVFFASSRISTSVIKLLIYTLPHSKLNPNSSALS